MARRLPWIFLAILPAALALLPCHAEPPPSPVLLPGFPLIAGDNVMLAWAPVPGAVSYTIIRDGKFLGTTGTSAYTTPVPAAGDEVRYQVSAVSGTGEASHPGPPGILQLRKIECPTGLEGAVNTDQPSVVLAWNAVRGSIGYNIYRMAGKGEPVLLHSGGDAQFRDRSVQKGSRYGYAVAAIDRYGREGNRSPSLAIEIPAEPQPPRAAQKPSGKSTRPGAGQKKKEAVKEGVSGKGPETEKAEEGGRPSRLDGTFREVMSIDKIRDAALWEVSYLGPGIDNVFWAVLPREREIHAISRAGEIVTTLGPAVLDSAGKGFVPHKLAAGADGRLVVSDVRNGTVACFNRKGDLLWSRKVDPPSGAERRVWEGFPESFRKLSPTPSSVLILPAEILVTDQRLQLIYRLGHDGEPRGYITHYTKKTDSWRLRRVGELEEVQGKGILLTFPLARKALLVNEEFRVLSEIGDSRKDRGAGFIGLHGVQFARGEGILFTDPTTGRIKLYDSDTGAYLRDLKTPTLVNPNMAVWDGNERLWVYLAREYRIAVLERVEAGK